MGQKPLSKGVRLERGSTSSYACQYDQRFSYYAYIPSSYDENLNIDYPLAVIVHGNERAAQKYRSVFKDFAEANQTIILAPLFPCGIIEPYDMDNYKFIKFHDIRFDYVLLAMVDELAEKYRIDHSQFLLHGFSGGGQFVHRFYYLHPDRLLGVSIGAPGRLTLLDRKDKGNPVLKGLSCFVTTIDKMVFPYSMTKSKKSLTTGLKFYPL
jgi:poly(3-hydroxybutyrate) depolymerase